MTFLGGFFRIFTHFRKILEDFTRFSAFLTDFRNEFNNNISSFSLGFDWFNSMNWIAIKENPGFFLLIKLAKGVGRGAVPIVKQTVKSGCGKFANREISAQRFVCPGRPLAAGQRYSGVTGGKMTSRDASANCCIPLALIATGVRPCTSQYVPEAMSPIFHVYNIWTSTAKSYSWSNKRQVTL